jgi:beta-lactamase superfamily II metal-dependent hydrolase
MHLTIFDVEHGFCAFAVASNGKALMIDCGRNETTGFSPSQHLLRQGRELELLIVSHYDEDHIADLPELRRSIPIRMLVKNDTISEVAMYLMKLKESTDISAAVSVMGPMIRDSIPTIERPDLADIQVQWFYNGYPEFEDENNLSVVAFVDSGDVHLIFPGDLEREGWLRLLERSDFRERLAGANYFVASHHGRDNGYCPEVFDICHPRAVIISDSTIEHGTQMHDFYARHASGVLADPRTIRYVYTTRSDGPITFDTAPVLANQYAPFV